MPTGNFETVIAAVCRYYDIDVEVLKSKSTDRRIIQARYVCFYLLHIKAEMVPYRIARLFAFHHTTVLYGIDKIRHNVRFYINFKERVSRIENILSNAEAIPVC